MRGAEKRFRLGVVVLGCFALLWALGGCALFSGKLPQEPGFHPRLMPRTFLETGQLMDLAVDTSAARLRLNNKFIPLGISVATQRLNKLTITREAFTLVDEAGHRYPLATIAESRAMGEITVADLRVSELWLEAMASRYHSHILQRMVFFPSTSNDSRVRNRSLVTERVELGKRMWTWDIMYFPRPEGELIGKKLELWMTAPELKEPVFVKFRIDK